MVSTLLDTPAATTVNNSTGNANLDLINATKNPGKAEAGTQKLADDFDQFLTLLTTQLKNQDPTDPMDTNEFTNQLVQFSIAEQAVAQNTNLEKLIDLQKSGEFDSALNYIGKEVEATGNAGELTNGFATFTYDLDAPAATVSLTISDGAGRAVYSGSGAKESGKNRVVWDGINSFNGADEADGTYFINVIAKNAAGETVASKTYTTGLVTSAQAQGDEMTLTVAGTTVKVKDVKAVTLPSSYSSNSSQDSTAGGSADDTVTGDSGN